MSSPNVASLAANNNEVGMPSSTKLRGMGGIDSSFGSNAHSHANTNTSSSKSNSNTRQRHEERKMRRVQAQSQGLEPGGSFSGSEKEKSLHQQQAKLRHRREMSKDPEGYDANSIFSDMKISVPSAGGAGDSVEGNASGEGEEISAHTWVPLSSSVNLSSSASKSRNAPTRGTVLTKIPSARRLLRRDKEREKDRDSKSEDPSGFEASEIFESSDIANRETDQTSGKSGNSSHSETPAGKGGNNNDSSQSSNMNFNRAEKKKPTNPVIGVLSRFRPRSRTNPLASSNSATTNGFHDSSTLNYQDSDDSDTVNNDQSVTAKQNSFSGNIQNHSNSNANTSSSNNKNNVRDSSSRNHAEGRKSGYAQINHGRSNQPQHQAQTQPQSILRRGTSQRSTNRDVSDSEDDAELLKAMVREQSSGSRGSNRISRRRATENAADRMDARAGKEKSGGGRNHGRDYYQTNNTSSSSSTLKLRHAHSTGTRATVMGVGGISEGNDTYDGGMDKFRATVGTFTVPTFSNDDVESSSKSRLSGRGSRLKSGSSRRSGRRSSTSIAMAEGKGSSVSNPGNGYRRGQSEGVRGSSSKDGVEKREKPFTGDFAAEDSDDDWMEQALLNGITSANKFEPGDIQADLDALQELLGDSGKDFDLRDFPSTSSLKGSIRSATSFRGDQHISFELPHRDRPGENRPSFGGSIGSSKSRPKYRKPKSSTADLEPYQPASDSSGASSRRQDGQRSTVVLPINEDTQRYRRKTSQETEKRRCTIGDLMDPQMALEYYMSTSNSEELNHEKKTQPNLAALSNIPILPTVITCTVTKQRPDEPAGLFLTKAKHGAVLVHSLSPESLFHKSSLQPGQEVLSVNEKRVNDPKMAATLITQSKDTLSLRISTTERPRGFQYCQVKRKAGPGDQGAISHGVRFITSSISGIPRRNLVTEGLVRVSHMDSHGLFTNSHPMNRLRVGAIILAVNGEPVTNGRSALEKVMGSRNLVEVLHCDDRVWREDWVNDGLEQILSGKERDREAVASSIFRKKDGHQGENKQGSEKIKEWVTEWTPGKGEVVIRKQEKGYAFKLNFSDDIGTCHVESVENEIMPPTDEFDVSILADSVNDSHRTMMQVLQNMLQRAKFEAKFGSEVRDRRKSGTLSAAPQGSSSSSRQNNGSNKIEHKMKQRTNSLDGIAMLFDDDESDTDMRELADSLLREDNRDRKPKRSSQDVGRNTVMLPLPEKDLEGRRKSTGFMNAVAASDDLEFLELLNKDGNNGVDRTEVLREYAARRKRAEERYDRSNEHKNYEGRQYSNTTSFASSMFSADMLEEFVSMSGSDRSFASISTQENYPQGDAPESPRQDEHQLETGALLSPKSQTDNSAETNNDDEEKAYITGVMRDVESKYDISSTIVGSGGFGEVRECTDRKTGQVHVVKTIPKPEPHDTTKINLIRNEILLLHEAHHPNIVELKDLFEDENYVHIVMERCTGGDLFDRVVNENPRRLRSRQEGLKHEARTANAMRSILNVLKYLHSKGIVHRDIKPEHFLLTTDQRETQKIKLIDFGLARKHKPGSAPMSTFTGSPSFVAPEVVARSYDHMCDMFSTGVTAYFLLTGMLPFDGPTDEETFDLISIGKFKFPSSSSVFLSDDAKDFITKLLEVDPRSRMSAEAALNHPWMLKAASC